MAFLNDANELIGYRSHVEPELARLDEDLRKKSHKNRLKAYIETCRDQRIMILDLVRMLEKHEQILAPLVRQALAKRAESTETYGGE